MTRFLVTGGAGYVGSHMVKMLAGEGHEVTVFDNLSRGHRDAVGRVTLIEGDLLDRDGLAALLRPGRFDVVMHFAALCYVGESACSPGKYYRNNVVGSLNLFDAMLAAGIDRLVFSSSCSTYGNPIETPIRETHPQDPLSPYGASKLMVERILRDYAAAHGLNSVSLRYFNAAGCDMEGELGERHDPETHLIPLLLQEVARVAGGADPAESSITVNGDDYETRDGTCIRDYVHVQDLAGAHLAAARRLGDALRGATAYNLGTGRGFTVLEVIESVRRVTGVPIRYRVGPRRPGDAAVLVADSGAARLDLGWRPQLTQLDDIVDTAWRWFRSRQDGARERAVAV